jgi:RimJ/RimL family protein N-acetyltransferase
VDTVETDRLVLRPFREDDLDEYAQMVGDPDVMRFIGDGHTHDREEAWKGIALALGHWQLRGYGLWAVVERASGALVGRSGLYNPEGWPGLEVGWLLARTCWGCGYATEAGRASLDYAWRQVGADHVISMIHPDNAASIRVAERLGETFERTIIRQGRPVSIYGVDRPDARPR